MFFYVKDDQFYVKCHNCSFSTTLQHFLKDFAPELYKQYMAEKFSNGESRKNMASKKKPEQVLHFDKPVFKVHRALDPLLHNDPLMVRITDLAESHLCKRYVLERQIPHKYHSILYYCRNFADWAEKLDPSKDLYPEDRLVIPFFDVDGRFFCAQGRSLSGSCSHSMRYITIRKAGDETPKWYGLERHDPTQRRTYVVEGPINSLFLPNCLANAGATALTDVDLPFIKENGILIYDNEKYNGEITRMMETELHRGFNVFIWPESVKVKDINDLVTELGWDQERIVRMIEDNTYNGLAGLMRLVAWRKQ
jgi:hypothetical protein